MVFHFPIPEGRERDHRLPILHTASFSGSYITCPQRGRGETDFLFFIQPHSQGLSLPHSRGEGERSQTPYSSYSLILINPPQRGRGETPDSLFFIQPHSQGLTLTHPRGEEESPQTPYTSYSLILRVFHYPTPEGKESDHRFPILHTASFSGSFITPSQRGRGKTTDSLYFIQPHSQGLSLPHSRGGGERPQTPYSSYSLILIHQPQKGRGETTDSDSLS